MSSSPVQSLPTYPVKATPEALAVVTLLKQGHLLSDLAPAYHDVAKWSPSAKDRGIRDQVAQDSLHLGLVLATTPGPWIQEWRTWQLPNRDAIDVSPYPTPYLRAKMTDEAFDLVMEYLSEEASVHAIGLSEEHLSMIGSGLYQYRASPLWLAQEGHMEEDSSLRRLLASETFKGALSSDLREALVQARFAFQQDEMSYEDAFGGFQRLIGLVEQAYPAPDKDTLDQQEVELSGSTVKVGVLRLSYALELDEVARETIAVHGHRILSETSLDLVAQINHQVEAQRQAREQTQAKRAIPAKPARQAPRPRHR